MFGIKMASEAIRTVRAIGQWGTHPWRNPADVGDDIDLAQSRSFQSTRAAKRFVRRNPRGFRFRIQYTVFYDRDVDISRLP